MIPSAERVLFDQITDIIYLGSRIASVGDYRSLRAEGVRACVDLKKEGADPWDFEAFLWLPTPDQDPPSPENLQMGLAFLRQCERSRLPVFVHCMAGVGRSPTLVLAHLLTGPYKNAGVHSALQFISSRRPVINPNAEQVKAAEAAAQEFAG